MKYLFAEGNRMKHKLATSLLSASLLLGAVSPAVSFAAELSKAPIAANIAVLNNITGTDDTVTVSGLTEGDLVNVYNVATGGEAVATATVESGKSDATLSKTDLLKAIGGTIYVSVTSPDKVASTRVGKAYAKEPVSTAPVAKDIKIFNNPTGNADTVTVPGLREGDIVRLYSTPSGAEALAEDVVQGANSSVTISKVDMLRSTGGIVYITVTSPNKLESLRVGSSYATEPVSPTLSASSITVKNNRLGISDSVVVTGLAPGDIISIYSSATGGTAIQTATVADNESSITLAIEQLGVNVGNIYVTQKKVGKLESIVRTSKTYESELSAALAASAIAVTNSFAGGADKVKVTGLASGDVIRVYSTATGGTALATATVENGATEAEVSQIDLLNANGGTAYVSVTRLNKAESSLRTAKAYTAGPLSDPVAADAITIVNNKAGMSDSVSVSGLGAGDEIKVYKALTGTTLIGSATVPVNGTSATVVVDQLGAAAGTVYVGVKRMNMLESTLRIAKSYVSEGSVAPAAATITIVNSTAGKNDTVTVTGLASGDVVNVYGVSKDGTVLATSTVTADAKSVTLSKPDMLTATGGIAYVTVTKPGKSESTRTAKAYVTEPVSAPLAQAAVTIENNKAGISDRVIVTDLSEGDSVYVYKTAVGGSVIGTSTVAPGETSATLLFEQLGASGGTVYVSVKRGDQLESKGRLAKNIGTETSLAPNAAALTVLNNPTGKADTVRVTGLAAGDIVTVYGVAKGGTALASNTVEVNQTETLVAQADMLTAAGGTAYITVTKANKLESARVAKAYISELLSVPLAATDITVENNKEGISDTVNVIGLQEGDTIFVYKTSSGGAAIGTAVVANGDTNALVSINQLGAAAGTVYVSVKRGDQEESARAVKAYLTETAAAPAVAAITVTNNPTGKADTVNVKGLAAGDVVKVYGSVKDTTVIASGTVAEAATEVTISGNDMLTVTGGTVFVTVTKVNKRESSRVAKGYVTEPVSAPVAESAITVTNNKVGVSDKVTVTGLSAGDKVMIFKSLIGGTAIGEAVIENGETSAEFTFDQLGTTAGTVYVGIKRVDQLESKTRTAKRYEAETTTAVLASNITVTNYKGAADMVKVAGLQAGDVVNVYLVSSGGEPVGTGTVAIGAASVTISIDQLSIAAGRVYVTVTRGEKLESARIAKDFAKEA